MEQRDGEVGSSSWRVKVMVRAWEMVVFRRWRVDRLAYYHYKLFCPALIVETRWLLIA